MASPSSRLWTIDALRGGAALGVVLFHASGSFGLSHSGIVEGGVDGILNWGRYGVWLFFVISGFCIHRQWALRARGGQQQLPDFLAFWRRRIRRLYPPYLAALVLYIALRHFLDGWPFTPATAAAIGLHIVLIQNLVPEALNAVNMVFWTLAIEEQLYLLYFVFLRVRIRWGWTSALTLGALTRALWFALAWVVHRAWGSDAIIVTQSAAAQWLVWILGALSVEAVVGTVTLPAWLRSGWTAGAVLVAAAGISHLYTYTDVFGSGALRHLVWLLTDPLWGAGCFVLVNAVVRQEGRLPSRAGATLARIGLFSYSLYLSHEIVTNYGARLLGAAVLRPGQSVSNLMLIPVLTLASIGVAWIFFVLFERPFMAAPRLRVVAAT
jgi:peptidoglycan/LPS O-acetylase OafA/YrhL